MVKNESTWLIMLPHAGGSTTIFKGLKKNINCNILNIEYPGHWMRMKEPLINSFSDLSKDVLRIIREKINKNSDIFLFGHSIGAIISWEITPLLVSQGFLVKGLFLSGSQNPGAFPEKSIIEATSDDKLLKLIGYEKKENEKDITDYFMKIFFPILKNDMEVCKSFICDNHYLNINSIVLYGTEDIFTDIIEMKKWKKYVNLIAMYGFTGGHLFIENEENIPKIIEIINNFISNI